MGLQKFGGFTAVVLDGWSAGRIAGTYSEEAQHTPVRFRPPDRRGELIVTVPWLDPEEMPDADPDELDALARDWGVRRGAVEPLSSEKELREGLARAGASYRIGDELVAVWFLSNGSKLLKVTWVSPWDARDDHRAARELILRSLRPA